MIPDNIDIHLLRSFLVLMAERNVSRAAERLSISQPAASHALGRLRVLFGDPLLLRSRDGMAPTNRALEIERSLSGLLTALDDLVAPRGRFHPELSRRTFVVTVTEYAEFVLAPSLIARMSAEAPHMRVHMRGPDPDRILDLLATGEVDLRFGWLQKPTPSLRSQQLFQDRLVCIARRDHPAIGGTLTLDQYMSLPHVRPHFTGRTTTGRVVDEAVAKLGGALNLALLVHNYLTVPFSVAQSDLIATVPARLAAPFLTLLPLRVLEPPIRLPRMRYAAYWHERNHKDPGHQWIRRLLLETARKLLPNTDLVEARQAERP
jgi:DNA-binding transcriptional LysR family regulator